MPARLIKIVIIVVVMPDLSFPSFSVINSVAYQEARHGNNK